ncbi:MAG: cache and HAMP domain-containing protein [Candidatus Wallbacteria bacterium]|nr:cache and HAMP domain-containing protein [Candidatus Wallbacteria bacterium]
MTTNITAPTGSSRPAGLRVQITRFFLVSVGLASTLALAVLYLGGREVMEAWVIRSNRYLARAVRRHLDHALTRGVDAGQSLARKLEASRADPARREQLLDSFLDFGEFFSNAFLFEAGGKLEAFRYAPGIAAGHARAGESYHAYPEPFPSVAARVLATGKPSFTPIFFTPSGRAQLAYVVPLAGAGGKPVELLSLALFAVTEQIDVWIDGLAPGRHGYIAVLDAQGRAIALTGSPPLRLQRAAREEPLALAADMPERITTMVFDGREDLVIEERSPSGSYWVLVGLPRDVALAPLAGLRLPALLALGAALILGLTAAWMLGRRILGPVHELVAGIRKVGEGAVSHRIPERRADELGEAARAFNGMAERLQRDQLIEDVWREVDRK